jgi:hypothetical protein
MGISVGGSQDTSCETVTVTDEHEEGEIIEEKGGDSDTLITSVSSPHSSPIWSSSFHAPITSASSVSDKLSPTNELCPRFTSTGTDIYNLHQVCDPYRPS